MFYYYDNPVFRIIYQHLQQAITIKERADLDSLLQTSLQVISGVAFTKIDEVNNNSDLRRDKPKIFKQSVINLIYTTFIFKLRLLMDNVEPLQKALVDAQSHKQVLIEE